MSRHNDGRGIVVPLSTGGDVFLNEDGILEDTNGYTAFYQEEIDDAMAKIGQAVNRRAQRRMENRRSSEDQAEDRRPMWASLRGDKSKPAKKKPTLAEQFLSSNIPDIRQNGRPNRRCPW